VHEKCNQSHFSLPGFRSSRARYEREIMKRIRKLIAALKNRYPNYGFFRGNAECLSDQVNLLKINEINDKRGVV
jgi:hypothetical protein